MNLWTLAGVLAGFGAGVPAGLWRGRRWIIQTPKTESNQVWANQIFGYLQAMNSKLDQIITDQRRRP